MQNVYVIGVSCTAFGKQPDKTFKDLTRQAFSEAVTDIGVDMAHQIEQAWFGNCGMGTFGQRNIRGQVCFTPLVSEGIFPERAPIINVEGGCATASMAFHGAYKDILSGEAQVSLAIGVEKTFFRTTQPGRWRSLRAASTSSIPRNGQSTTGAQAMRPASRFSPTQAGERCSWTPTPCRRRIT